MSPSKKRTRSVVREQLPNAVPTSSIPAFRPQLATVADAIPQGRNWLHEIKFDGYRLLCFLQSGKARLITRGGNDWTSKFREIAEAIESIPVASAVVDGELVAVDADGKPSFQALQRALKSGPHRALTFCAFDLPYCNGYDLRPAPLVDRKSLLKRLIRSARRTPVLIYSEHAQNGKALYKHACEQGLEGIISKRRDSEYVSGRTTTWVKNKRTRRQEFIIGGFTEPEGSRAGFGSLLLGYNTLGAGKGESELMYSGNVGTGFDDATIRDLFRRLQALESDHSPFGKRPKGIALRTVHWVEPKLVVEVRFTGWTEDGRLREPSFVGLREDKEPREVVREDLNSSRPHEHDRAL